MDSLFQAKIQNWWTGFLESMIVKTVLSNKPFGEKKDMHSAGEGRKWSVLLWLCCMYIDYLITMKT